LTTNFSGRLLPAALMFLLIAAGGLSVYSRVRLVQISVAAGNRDVHVCVGGAQRLFFLSYDSLFHFYPFTHSFFLEKKDA